MVAYVAMPSPLARHAGETELEALVTAFEELGVLPVAGVA